MKTFNETIILPAAEDVIAARCSSLGGLTGLFFSDDFWDIIRAKAICQRCSDRSACLQGAIDREEPAGVWGGELIANGKVVVGLRPRGRPPVKERGPIVVQEVPIPESCVA